MRTSLKITGFAIVIILAALVWLKVSYLKGPVRQTEGELILTGLENPVNVFTDEFGVSHVYAESEEDLFYAAGYIMASERLYKMDVITRAVEGRLAEAFGPDLVESDKFLRTYGFMRVSKKVVEEMDAELLHLLQNAVEGINYYIDTHENDLPVEFKIAGHKPTKWTVEHMVGYSRLMAHDLQLAWLPEVIFGKVLDELGEEMAQELFPVYPDTKPYIVPKIPKNFSAIADLMIEQEEKIREITGAKGSHIGSNSWVVSGAKTKSGKPILSNDPHLGFSQPAVWYDIHLVGGRFDVAGVALAGIPLVLIGQNQHYAWGFTNVMMDDTDFYMETTSEKYPNKYFHDGEWKGMIVHEETILVKGEDPVHYTVRETHHGPIISDVHPMWKDGPQAVSMAWVGNNVTDEVGAIYGLNLAQNWDEFSDAVSKFSVPGQNMIYADIDGNIGWRPATAIPIRKDGTGLVPMPGDDSQYDWKGFVPFEEMPYLLNPERGFIATANNKTIGDEFPYYISAYWEPPARIARIEELLKDKTDFEVDDMKAIQTDILSDFSRDALPKMIQLAEQQNSLDEKSKLAIGLLKEWDNRHMVSGITPTLFNTWWVEFINATYGDEMDQLGDQFRKGFFKLANLSYRNGLYLLQKGSSPWFDDVTTPNKVESASDIVALSLANAIAFLENELGENTNEWQWGRLHTLTHEHPMAKIALLEKMLRLNVGPFAVGGTGTTVNNMEFKLFTPYKVVLGPSMRRIVDFAEFDSGTRAILPTGQSGNPVSPHYRDQSDLYNSGQYRFFPTNKELIQNVGYQKMVFKSK